MTREKAIKVLKENYAHHVTYDSDCGWDTALAEAVKMAIQDLEQEPCKDAISRQAVLDKAFEIKTGKHTSAMVVYTHDIRVFPSVNPQPKTGHWKPYLKEGLRYQCSACDSRFDTPWNYCPNCGAKMVESQENNNVNCKTTKCENCTNHNCCDYESRESEER